MIKLGPLTTTFTPSPSCSSVAGYTLSYFDNNGRDYYLAQGPLTTKGCFPSDYSPSSQYYYSPGICPAGYTIACSHTVAVGTLTDTIGTCCPTALSTPFECQGPVQKQWPWQSTLGCQYAFPSTGNVTLAPVTLISEPETWVTASSVFLPGGAVGAYAIVIAYGQTVDATITSGSSATGSGSGGGSDHGGGLSSGAAAGIGAGCGVAAVLLLGAGALLLWRKRRRARGAAEPVAVSPGSGDKPVAGGVGQEPYSVGYAHYMAGMAERQTPMEYGDAAPTQRRHHEGPFELPHEPPTR